MRNRFAHFVHRTSFALTTIVGMFAGCDGAGPQDMLPTLQDSQPGRAVESAPATGTEEARIELNLGPAGNDVVNPGSANLVPSPMHFVVITTKAIKAASANLPKFVQLKQSQGYVVEVITEETWGGGTGDAAANKLRAWLAANYVSHTIAYVLLIGNPDPNTGDVPMKKANPHGAGTACTYGYYEGTYGYIPTDFYYAELNGNWDLNKNGIVAELPDHDTGSDLGAGGYDLHAEVAVGRIPYYGVAADLDAILAKIVTYQSATTGQAWRNKALFALDEFDSYSADDPTRAYDPRLLFEQLKASVLTPAGFSTYRIYKDVYQAAPPPEMFPTTKDNVLAAWKTNKPGLVVYASPSPADVYAYPFNAKAANSVIDIVSAGSLDNTNPAMVIQLAHDNAFPEEPANLAYTLLKKGGISVVGATRGIESYYCTDCSMPWTNAFYSGPFRRADGVESFGYDLTELIVTRKMSIGQALVERNAAVAGTFNNANPVFALEFNLYGDPSTQLGIIPSAQNLAIGKTATAASSASASVGPANAIDGTVSSAWKAASATSQWLQVDLAASKRYNAVVVNQSGSVITGFQIQNWNGSAWATVYTGTSMGGRVVVLFPPVTGSKVKLTITGASAAPSISELEVYDATNDVLWVEGEKMTLTNFASEANTAASGGAGAKVPSTGTGIAKYIFSGTSEKKDITVDYFDENDGASTWKLYVANVLKSSWTANKNLGSASAVAATLTSATVAAVQVNSGDEIRVEGTANSGESARLDRVRIVASRLGNKVPTVQTAAATSLTTVTAKTTTLTVLGADDAGESNLYYTWETTGAAPGFVSFADNMTNQGKQSVATFLAAGTYNLRAVITDTAGLSVTSNVSQAVVVKQTLSTLTLNSVYAVVPALSAFQFQAKAIDQFGYPMAPQPSMFTWTVSGCGTISSTGLFIAAGTVGERCEVTASIGNVSAVAVLDVVARPTYELEAENLTYTSDLCAEIVADSRHSGGKAVQLCNASTPTPGNRIRFMLPIAAGDYDVQIYFKSNTNRATVWLTPDGYCQVEHPIFNEYAPLPTKFQSMVDMGSCYFRPENTPNNYLEFVVDGKVAESTAYTMLVDKIVLTPL